MQYSPGNVGEKVNDCSANFPTQLIQKLPTAQFDHANFKMCMWQPRFENRYYGSEMFDEAVASFNIRLGVCRRKKSPCGDFLKTCWVFVLFRAMALASVYVYAACGVQ